MSTRYLSEHVARKLRHANVPAVKLHDKLDQESVIVKLGVCTVYFIW